MDYKSWLDNVFENTVRTHRGFGIVLIHRSHQALVPTLHSALAQVGFRNILRNVLWMKQMSDGTQRALIIYIYDRHSVEKDKYVVRHAKNIFIIAEGSDSLVAPVFVNSVTNTDQSSMTSPLTFNVPLDASGSTMMCDHVFAVSSRDMQEFTPPLQQAIEGTRDVTCYSKYVMLITPQHEYQLGTILESITNAFKTQNNKRMAVYKLKKDFPDTIPMVQIIRQLGLEGEVLLKVVDDHFIYYYMLLDELAYVLSDVHPYYMLLHLAWWIKGYHRACWRFAEYMYNHPNNVHVKEAIGELMKRIQIKICSSNPAWCNSVCRHNQLHN